MERILFITATRIGDAVLSTGVLAHLIETRPQAKITVACGPLAAPIFRAAPGVERVIVMAKRKAGGHWLSLWGRTVMRPWSQVIDLRASATSWFLAARRRAVKRGKAAGPIHKVIENARVLKLDPPPEPVLWFDDAARAEADALSPAEPYLALAPAAAAPFKEWPPERFAALARALTGPDGAMAGAPIVIFGGPGDEATAAAAAKGLDPAQVIDTTGRLGVLQAGAAFTRAQLFVGNDSGLMHLAAAAGAPTLGLFGPTDERLYGPWGPKARSIRAGGPAEEKDRARLRFSETSLMGRLGVAPVLAAAEHLLKETS